MKLPKRIKVGVVNYKIELIARSEMAHDDGWGCARHRARIISLAADLPDADLASTLLHEILHCVFTIFTIDTDDSEERTVKALEYGLTTVMHDNPGLFAAIEKEMR